jgi:hypothetical protein
MPRLSIFDVNIKRFLLAKRVSKNRVCTGHSRLPLSQKRGLLFSQVPDCTCTMLQEGVLS